MNGRHVAWDEATLHVGCEAVTRALSVFEGVKGYRQPDGTLGIVMLRRHFERLRRSARLLHIPCDYTYDQYETAIADLTRALLQPGREMWLRTTLYGVEGHWGDGTVADLVITGYQAEMAPPEPINLGVSTWRRSDDVSLPARAKSGANYQVARLARIEGRAQGCQDMVLLNQWGRVAEATGAAILMVRDGTVYTPPATEGALESITVDLVEALARSLGIEFVRRPIDRTELLVADEVAICGTLAEVTPARTIEGRSLPQPSVLRRLEERYFEAVRGIAPHASVELTCVTPRTAESEALPAATVAV
jgi:branched-chain amino acid aminotransferase